MTRLRVRMLIAAWIATEATAQVNWMRPAITSPAGNAGECLTWDSRRQKVLRTHTGFPLQTWEYDATGWLQRFPAHVPLSRSFGVLAFDTSRVRAVLFGGQQLPTTLADTWEWDGSDWAFVSQRLPPPPRAFAAMAYDPRRAQMVMFGGGRGGFTQISVAFNDTWTWDGTVWNQMAPASSPSARGGHTLAYDRQRDVMVMFGGLTTSGTELSDTWEWDGTNWHQRMPAHSPLPRSYHAMAYDADRGRVVLFGGGLMSLPSFNDTWEWDGMDWVQRQPTAVPFPSLGPVMAYDETRGRCVLFGGLAAVTATWEYGPVSPAVFVPFGHGCAGSAGAPALRRIGLGPWLGDTLNVRLEAIPATAPALLFFGLSASTWGGVPLPLPLDALGLTGCTLYSSLDVSWALTNQGGFADASLPIPARPDLLGFTSYLQALVLDPGANPFGATLSQGVGTRVGGK